MTTGQLVLPTAYLPPISWFAQLCSGEPIVIEQYEHFHKQTIRNRCTIDAPNGVLNLTVPIDKSNFSAGAKCLMKDVRISYREDWQHQHWNAIQSSYFNSPFFEYLQDDFRPIYQQHWTFLMDLNEALITKCCELIDIQPQISRSEDFILQSNGSKFQDSSSKFQSSGSKSQDSTVNCQLSTVNSQFPPYYQVFAHKHGFQPDLSIIDLLFNLGLESLLYLNK